MPLVYGSFLKPDSTIESQDEILSDQIINLDSDGQWSIMIYDERPLIYMYDPRTFHDANAFSPFDQDRYQHLLNLDQMGYLDDQHRRDLDQWIQTSLSIRYQNQVYRLDATPQWWCLDKIHHT